jgi:flagellar biosynthesis/type III secretory pathway M-ring protein FliF/YscJ
MQFKQIEITDVPQDQFVNASTSNQWKMFMLDHGKTVALALILGIIFLMLVRIVNSYAPPIEVAYANIIGQQAGRIAEALPAAGAVQIVKRNDAAVSEKQEQIAKQLPEVQRRQGGEINFVETAPSITIETPVTSEEKLRLKAAKIQTEELIKQNSNDAVKVIRSWMSEG